MNPDWDGAAFRNYPGCRWELAVTRFASDNARSEDPVSTSSVTPGSRKGQWWIQRGDSIWSGHDLLWPAHGGRSPEGRRAPLPCQMEVTCCWALLAGTQWPVDLEDGRQLAHSMHGLAHSIHGDELATRGYVVRPGTDAHGPWMVWLHPCQQPPSPALVGGLDRLPERHRSRSRGLAGTVCCSSRHWNWSPCEPAGFVPEPGTACQWGMFHVKLRAADGLDSMVSRALGGWTGVLGGRFGGKFGAVLDGIAIENRRMTLQRAIHGDRSSFYYSGARRVGRRGAVLHSRGVFGLSAENC